MQYMHRFTWIYRHYYCHISIYMLLGNRAIGIKWKRHKTNNTYIANVDFEKKKMMSRAKIQLNLLLKNALVSSTDFLHLFFTQSTFFVQFRQIFRNKSAILMKSDLLHRDFWNCNFQTLTHQSMNIWFVYDRKEWNWHWTILCFVEIYCSNLPVTHNSILTFSVRS